MSTKNTPKTEVKTNTLRALWGGWNKDRSALLTYNLDGKWISKVSAIRAPQQIDAGEIAPLSSRFENRKSVSVDEIRARAAELEAARPAKKEKAPKPEPAKKAEAKPAAKKVAKKAAKPSAKKAATKKPAAKKAAPKAAKKAATKKDEAK